MVSKNPELLSDIAPLVAVVVLIGVVGWGSYNLDANQTWYPLENSMGGVLHPQIDRETADQMKLLNQENTQLRDELAGLKDRLATVERIVADSGYNLDQEIERLRDKANWGEV